MRTRPTRLLLPAAALAALALVAAGCGGGGKKSTAKPAAPAAKGAGVTIRESEYKLNPANPKVAKTGAVSFQVSNNGTISHALEVEGPKGEARLHTLKPGSSGTLTVDLSKPGKYEFYCPIDGHKKLGMKGEVVVAGGGKSKSSAAPKAPPSSGGGGGASGY